MPRLVKVMHDAVAFEISRRRKIVEQYRKDEECLSEKYLAATKVNEEQIQRTLAIIDALEKGAEL